MSQRRERLSLFSTYQAILEAHRSTSTIPTPKILRSTWLSTRRTTRKDDGDDRTPTANARDESPVNQFNGRLSNTPTHQSKQNPFVVSLH